MKTLLFLFPFYIQGPVVCSLNVVASLSVPVLDEKNPRHPSKPKIVKAIWSEARHHVINDIAEQLLGKQKLNHDDADARMDITNRLEDTGALQYARQLAIFRRRKRCIDFGCSDGKATEGTTSTTTTTSPSPPSIKPTTTTQTTTQKTTTEKTTPKPETQSSDSGPSNSGSKIGWCFPFPFQFPKIPSSFPRLPKFPCSG